MTNNLIRRDWTTYYYPNLTLTINENPFKWNGEFLGIVKKGMITGKIVKNNLHYWRINYKEYETIGIVRRCQKLHPCLIDEMKPIFGMKKLGTHWFIIEGSKAKYILTRVITDNEGKIFSELRLKDIPLLPNSTFVQQIQEVFVFRDFLGLKSTSDSTIVIRRQKTVKAFPIPISCFEKRITLDSNVNIISSTVFNKWFSQVNYNTVARRLLNINAIEEVSIRYNEIRNKLNILFNRIDPDSIYLITIIMNRINSKIMSDWEGPKVYSFEEIYENKDEHSQEIENLWERLPPVSPAFRCIDIKDEIPTPPSSNNPSPAIRDIAPFVAVFRDNEFFKKKKTYFPKCTISK